MKKINILYALTTFLLIFFYNAGKHDLPYQTAFIGVLLTIAIFFFIVFLRKGVPILKLRPLEFILLSLIYLSLVLSLLFNLDGSNAKAHFSLLIFLFISYSISSFICENSSRVESVEKSIVLSMVGSFIFGIYLFNVYHLDFAGIYLRQEYALRSNSFFSLSTTYGIYSCLGILYSLKLYMNSRKNIYIIAAFCLFFATLSSGSRTGLTALLIAITFAFSLMLTSGLLRKKATVLLSLTLIPLISISAYMIFINLSDDVIKEVFVLDRFVNGDTDSLGGRTEKIERGIMIFNSSSTLNNIFGLGSDGYANILLKSFAMSPHSGVIRIFNDYGLIFNFLLYSTILIVIFKNSIIYIKTKSFEILMLLCSFIYLFVCETMVNSLFVLSLETFYLVYIFTNLCKFSFNYHASLSDE